MGNIAAPLNSTVFNQSLTTDNSGTSGRHTLNVGGAQPITLSTICSTIEFIPTVIPAWPIYIKWHTTSVTSAATASNFDEVITDAKPALQVGIMPFVTGYSIYSASNQTVHTIERP